MGEYWFNTTYLGICVPQSGNMIDPEKIGHFDRTPSVRTAKQRILYVDPAFTDGNLNPRADETVISILDYDQGNFYLFKQYAGRWATSKTKKEITKAYNYWKPDTAWIEEVSASKIMINDLLDDGIPIRGYKPGNQKKESRLMELIPYIEAGRLFFKTQEDWSTLLEQIRATPFCRFDDRIDSLYGAIHNIAGSGNPFTESTLGYIGSILLVSVVTVQLKDRFILEIKRWTGLIRIVLDVVMLRILMIGEGGISIEFRVFGEG